MKLERTIKVDCLARIEGEAGLTVRIMDTGSIDVKFRVFEPPRFFEAFLRGRSFREIGDITARICGICPVAYIMSSAAAIENAFGAEPGPRIRDLRKMIYLGEWIESHALHIYMLHAPDFLGYDDAVKLAMDHREVVEQGLGLKKLGNDVVRILGGREVHPVNCRVGGFYGLPEHRVLQGMTERIKRARDAAVATVRWTAGFHFPDFEQDYEFVALSHPHEYALLDGRLISSKGLDMDISGFEDVFKEEQVEHSTSLHSRMKDGCLYLTGPMARFNLNFEKLSKTAREAAREAGLKPPCFNPFKSIVIRSVELVHACDEILLILESLELPDPPAIEVHPRAGTGIGCTEAPRGICWHRYTFDDHGTVLSARIVPPTAQNQKIIECDIMQFVANNRNLSDDKLVRMCEQVIRNADPCISCSCHCIDLRRTAHAGIRKIG
ncbi:MAG: nickel-dependent hydrogenase large subunit [Pseudomonadota bacterium]